MTARRQPKPKKPAAKKPVKRKTAAKRPRTRKPKPPTRGEKVIAFIERFCRIPDGAKVGQPIKLLEFQKRFILEVYDNPAGTRRGYLSIGRKNGKTALIACLLLVHLVGPEAKVNSQIVSGALSRDQASLVFNLALKIVRLSPVLRKIVREVESAKKLIGLPLNTEFKALAAQATTAHGLSPVLAILDETGQVKGPRSDFIDAITTAQGAHAEPLLLAISTQAPTDADLFSVWLDDAESSQDPTIVSHVYTAPADCELEDPEAWAAANPAIGEFRSRKDVEEQAKQAARMPVNEASFRVLILNQRVNLTQAFVAPSIWKAGNEEPGPFDGLVYGGLDLAATTDLTSLVLVNRQGENLGVRAYFWIPEDNLVEADRRDRAPYVLWHRQGFVRTTPGRVIDYAFIARDVGQICAGLNIAKIGFDRWRMDRLKTQLELAGVELPLEPFGQGFVSMSPALDALESELLREKLRHGGHPCLAFCARNAVAVQDPAGNRKLDKEKATGRIDGMVALAMATGLEAQAEKPVESIYQRRARLKREAKENGHLVGDA